MTDRGLRVLIIEDHLLARVGTATLLSSEVGIDVVGQAGSGAQGLEMFKALRPDIVIQDLRMPGMDGRQCIEQLKQLDPDVRVLVLTHYDGEESIFLALEAGALGYLTKDTEADELFRGIRAVAAGERYLPAPVALRLAARESAPPLSPREMQVLQHIFAGLSNKEIASELEISEKTVAMFVLRLFAKLRVKSRTEAVATALRRGVLQP